MTAKTCILFDEECEVSRHPSKRKWSKSTYSKMIILATSALLAIVLTAIYYGVFLGTEEILHDIEQSESVHLLTETTTRPFRNFYPVEISKKKLWRKLNRHKHRGSRKKRDVVEEFLIDPLEYEFNQLRAKIRNKRTKVELSKLEKDYTKCKKESLRHSDCMATFIKMYSIAKDISEKMEKMKEIFRDSELHLHQNSMSSSMEKLLDIDKSVKDNKTTPKPITISQEWDGEVTFKPEDEKFVLDKEGDNHTADDEVTLNPEVENKKTTPKPISQEWDSEVTFKPDDKIFFLDDEEEQDTTDDEVTLKSEVGYENATSMPISQEWVGEVTFKPVLLDEEEKQDTTDDEVTLSPEVKKIVIDQGVIEKILTETTTEDATNIPAEELDYVTVTKFDFSTVSDTSSKTYSTEAQTTEEIEVETEVINEVTSSVDLTTEGVTPTGFDIITNTNSSTTTDSEVLWQLEDVTKSLTTINDQSTTTLPNTSTEGFHTVSVEVNVPTEASSAMDTSASTFPILNASTEMTQIDIDTTFTIDIHSTSEPVPQIDTSTGVTTTIEVIPVTLDWGYLATITSTELNFNAATEKSSPNERAFNSEDSSAGLKSVISNHKTDVKVFYRGKCGATSFEYKTPTVRSNDCHDPTTEGPFPEVKSQVEPATDNTTAASPKNPVKKKEKPQENGDHPLDYPSSRENMLDDPAFKPKPTDIHDKWEKKFEDGSVEHNKNTTTKPHTELMDSFGVFDHISADKFGPKMNPANKAHGGNNPQLMTLCEHLAKQIRSKVTSVPETSDDITPSPNIQFTSRGPGFPVTGETMKASAQFMFNPNFGVPSIPVCFYITPASFRMMMQPFWSPFFGMQGMSVGNGGNSGHPGGGIFIVPPSFGNMQNNGNFFGHSSPTGGGSQSNIPNIFSKSASSQQQQQKPQQFFCTYMQNAGKQSPGSSGLSNINFKLRNSSGNESSPIDIIYSSYWNKLPGHYGSNLGQEDRFQCPLEGDVPCYGGNECVPEKKWCDSIVDCSDGSDEAACTCRKRIHEHKICDGYQDCPLGEDEIGCFGCDKFMYSCYDNVEEFERANRSTLAMCYSSAERCDGAKNCINGRDENGCNLIVSDLTHHMSHAVSGSAGYLYRNYHGVWYPVCNNAQKWAREACTEELGNLVDNPVVSFQQIELQGPFIEPHHMGEAHFPQSCQKRERDVLSDHVAHVRCPLPKCGIINESTSPLMRSKRRRRREAAEKDSRIVGGSDSKPLQWPFIVAIYKNGEFHCGGTIFNEQWIITAAHCTIGFHKHFYEVRAGMLRRSSFSSSTQIHHVTHVVVHQGYERRTMKNDLALVRIDTPLRFNRWVKPICLPNEGRTTMGDDWIWGPEADTICTAVGWGAVREKGPGSERLKEVHLPIRRRCTEKDDQEAEDICAGEVVGGRDACQGDSGGPLFCRSVSNSKEWYLAGVVSHGNGCARAKEFGVYTRVALYLDWIEMALRPEYLPKVQPKQLCPGYVCIWGGKRCITKAKRCDRLVDCLGGEDEVGCIYNYIPDVGAALNASTTPMMHDSDWTDLDELTTTDSGFNAKNLFGDFNGGDTDPSSLENGNVSTSTTTDIETTDSSHPGLKSLLDWVIGENVTIPESTTLDSTTTTWISTEPIIEESSISTRLPTSTAELTKLQDLAVKLLEAADRSTTAGISIETTTPITTSIFSTESTKRTEVTSATGFGDFKADLPQATSEIPTSVHKRENATEEGTSTIQPKTMPKHISKKFVCEKIPQIIDINNRCDRISDCEDGTDEDGCTCRQYLKGPLNILICDGKVDCEDLTDEDDCGNCTSTQFLCPMSKTCIESKKRCDNFVDCEFKEDEKDCFALTNGKEIRLDKNKQPTLQSAGIFSRNTNGVWRVVCSHETGFHTHASKTAEEICSLLGFKGSKFYNTSEITHHTIVPIDPDFVQMAYLKDAFPVGDSVHFTDGSKHMPRLGVTSSRSEIIEKVAENCLGLFVECVAKANGSTPLKTFNAGEEISPKTLDIHGLAPNVKPNLSDIFAQKKDEILDKLSTLIETKKTVLVHNKLHEGLEKWHWPWLVDVYANGVVWCVGVLVDKHWVLVHESCYYGVRLDIDYVTVLLGGGKSKHTHHKSPHEQIKRVDCFEAVENSDVLLLHLDYAAHFTRHVLPTFLPDISLTEKENGKTLDKHRPECMSVVHDKFGGIKVTPTVGKSVAVAKSDYNNASGTMCDEDNELSCYQWDPTAIVDFKLKHLGGEELVGAADQEEETKSLFGFCKDLNSNMGYPYNQGVIVCREDNSGWYPMAFYTYNATECNNLKQPFPVRTLERYYGYIQDIIDQPKCGNSYPRPHCPTLRCPLGNCLLPEQMCNGKVDCHDGSDEEKEFCRLHRNECKASELKCRSNGKCIPKKKFCDHIADCEDLTDEPTICSCFTYLQATDPGKICDGIRNCWDKSDESPVLCNCTSNRFPCGSSPSECIPKDFVCDKEPDCPNGEDEQFCYGIEHPITSESSKRPQFPQGYGQVIEQSYGIWHTKCFPRQRPPDSAEVVLICRKLGYHGSKPPSYRLIDDIADIVAAAKVGKGFNESPAKYRDATKAVVINKFSPLHLNDDLTLILKPSRPIAELVKWNETDSSNCYRLEIKCG